jgi:lipopolysaccharide/colanic/teichoic acid biosynthesis glycosyltransferase
MALAGLIFAAPLIGLSSLAILLGSPGPIIYRQTRVGRHGRLFVLYKLRTMRSSNAGPQVTAGDDARITRVGMLLRKTKLDELPELWNVFKGDMSLVGPRPEVPRYVNFDDPTWRRVLEVRPGITDPVTLRLRNEETLLAEVKGDREQFYLDTLQPFKLRGYLQYLQRRSLSNDVKILWQTAVTVLLPGKAPPPTRSEIMNCFGSRASEGMLTRGRTRSEETTSR